MFFPIYISNEQKWYISSKDDKDCIEILDEFGCFDSYEEVKETINNLEEAWKDTFGNNVNK